LLVPPTSADGSAHLGSAAINRAASQAEEAERHAEVRAARWRGADNRAWQAGFQREAGTLTNASGADVTGGVHHVGSTAARSVIAEVRR
jgi:GrpB-like predicted nucleotidyltransferase (UPF0157 family)